MKLTAHFSLEEFLISDAAHRIGDKNEPTEEHLTNLHILASGMEKAREILGNRAIVITSGYRNARVNSAVGGVPDSDHAKGYAADFHVAGLTPLAAGKILWASDLMYDQLILETSRNILHLSFAPRMRRQALTQRAGAGTPFEVGLVR